MKFKLLTSIVILSLSVLCYIGKTESIQANPIFDINVEVATRTSDSTGQLTITNSQIQSGIISTIPSLNNATITSDPASLVLSKRVSYLMFRVNADSGRTTAVAVELIATNSKFIYQVIPGKQIHRCNSKKYVPCNFIINKYKYIVGCGCNQQTTISDSCQYVFFSEE